MRLALTLGGTDYGRSGIGVYTRAIIPRLQRALEETDDELVVLGTPKEIQSYQDVLSGIRRIVLSSTFTTPGLNALFHLLAAGPFLGRMGNSVLLLPAGSRRMLLHSPIPTVAVVHDLAQLHVARKYDVLRMAYFRHALLPALNRAAKIVAISAATKNDLVNALHCPQERIAVVPNGVESARFPPPAENDPRILQVRERFGLSGPYILYLGRLEHPGKNHVRLIEAFAASKVAARHSLVLAGADWGALPRIREAAVRLGIEHRVILTGFVPDELVPGLVAGADSVAMVGLHEGFGLPAVEALAAGRPLFVAKTGALTEVTGNLAAICDPLDCDSIRGALDKTIADGPFRQRALDEGPGFARRYDWDLTAEALLSLCREAARAGRVAEGLQRGAECAP